MLRYANRCLFPIRKNTICQVKVKLMLSLNVKFFLDNLRILYNFSQKIVFFIFTILTVFFSINSHYNHTKPFQNRTTKIIRFK